MSMAETNTFSIGWELKKIGQTSKQKELIYLNLFQDRQQLFVACHKCDGYMRSQPERSENDLCVKVLKTNEERSLSIVVPHSVGNIIQELTVLDISGLPIFQKKYEPKITKLIESLPLEQYLGQSGTLIVRLTRQSVNDLSALSKKYCEDELSSLTVNPASAEEVSDEKDEEPNMETVIADNTSQESAPDSPVLQLPSPVMPVTFVFNDGSRLVACKARLCMKSCVFATMFSLPQASPTMEGVTNEVKISDCDSNTYRRFLQFVLFDREVYLKTRGESLKECAEQILPLANKYWIHDLAERCAVVLVDNLTESCALRVIELLQVHYSGGMKQQCLDKALDFIKENPAVMKNTSKWDDLSKKYPQLLREVIINCLVKKEKKKRH